MIYLCSLPLIKSFFSVIESIIDSWSIVVIFQFTLYYLLFFSLKLANFYWLDIIKVIASFHQFAIA
jgi:hypothetical protein